MAVKKLPDGRWICYYKKGGQVKKEYFGRGDSGQAAANKRHKKLGLGRPKKKDARPWPKSRC